MSMFKTMAAKMAGRVLVVLFVVAIPFLLVTASVTWAVNEPRLYEYGFDKYHISSVTGIDEEDLTTAAGQIRSYFNSGNGPLDIRTRIYGEERELFSRREVIHMEDVKRLIWGAYWVAIGAAVYLLVFAVGGFYIHRRPFAIALSRYILWGGILTLAFVVAVGLIALTGFDALFLFFHRASFSNDFWQLNPQRDYLVMMFPQGFWFDATMFVALATVGMAVLLGGISGGFLAWRHWLIRRRQGPLHTAPL